MPSGDNGVRTIRSARWYYDNMPDEQRRCRGKRLHDFPDLQPSDRVLADGIRITGLGRSQYVTTKECNRGCGLVRVEYSRWLRGHFVQTRKPGYIHPEDWMVVPRGVLSAGDIRQITMDACHDLIVRFAKPLEQTA